jgi:murein DD-endopeptidase MepM/ murein hydrolase activator NlpD
MVRWHAFDACGSRADPRGVKGVRGGLIAVLAALAVACGGGEAAPTATPTQAFVVRTPIVPPTVVATPATPTVTPNPSSETLDPRIPRPFTWPIAGACLPQAELLMPNAPRTYRNGVHEGLDFYPGSSCAQVVFGTQVLAMYEGTVIRADLDYKDITAQQVQELAALTARQGFSDPVTLDIYRGRQVWIDHGGGVVTRYCHLSAIATGIRVGARVKAGDVLGGVGESGTPEFITAPGTEMHLHAEVRVGDSFLGAGMTPEAVRRVYGQLFGTASAASPVR